MGRACLYKMSVRKNFSAGAYGDTLRLRRKQRYSTFETLLLGDMDGSGTLDSTDVFYLMLGIAQSAVGISPDWTAAQEKAADIDGSGRADSTDVFYLMLYIAQNGAGIPTVWEDIIG